MVALDYEQKKERMGRAAKKKRERKEQRLIKLVDLEERKPEALLAVRDRLLV